MPRIGGVVYALLALGESRQSVFGPKRYKVVLSACKYLMRITLMTYVKYQSVGIKIKYVMKGYDKFYYSEIRRKMSAFLQYDAKYQFSDLGSELFQLRNIEKFNILRRIYVTEYTHLFLFSVLLFLSLIAASCEERYCLSRQYYIFFGIFYGKTLHTCLASHGQARNSC